MILPTIETLYKSPTENFPIGFTYSAPDLDSGESISSAVVTATTGLTVGTPVVVSPRVTVRISGGTSGADYTVTFTITTSAANVYVDQILVRVR